MDVRKFVLYWNPNFANIYYSKKKIWMVFLNIRENR